ncbi:MAG: hypothetical protein HN348_01485, partial [Proteobacteria bacterium]|nr:hypothetical protein [Pseudomonadota bacterium]
GGDADRKTMEDFAKWGGGNYYLVTDPNSIPAIFSRETLLATRAFLVEEPFRPALASPSDLLVGLRAKDFPTLYGFVGVEPKDRAVIAMTAEHEEKRLPLLAHWHYGLGRSVAFTSDSKPRWSRDWVGTESYTRFWSQVVRWTVGDQDASNLIVDAEIEEGELIITVDAFDSMGSFQNFLKGEARVIGPDLSVHPLDLRQVAPGRYQSVMPVNQNGSWLVGVALKEGEETVGQAVAEAVQPYSPEYQSQGAGAALVAELGRLGGAGTIVEPKDVFARPTVLRAVPRPIWPWLMAAAALLLLFDVALRRLDFTRAPGELIEARARATAPSGWRPPAQVERPPRPGDDVDDGVEEEVSTTNKKPKVEVAPDSYAGRLLAARRSARRKMDGDDK